MDNRAILYRVLLEQEAAMDDTAKAVASVATASLRRYGGRGEAITAYTLRRVMRDVDDALDALYGPSRSRVGEGQLMRRMDADAQRVRLGAFGAAIASTRKKLRANVAGDVLGAMDAQASRDRPKR